MTNFWDLFFTVSSERQNARTQRVFNAAKQSLEVAEENALYSLHCVEHAKARLLLLQKRVEKVEV